MKDLPEMTVQEHHELCMGVLACCFQHVPTHIRAAIYQACQSAQAMGMKIEADNLLKGEPLSTEIRMLSA